MGKHAPSDGSSGLGVEELDCMLLFVFNVSCSSDKSIGHLHVWWMDKDDRLFGELVRRSLPEYVVVIQDFLAGCGLTFEEATGQLRREDERGFNL